MKKKWIALIVITILILLGIIIFLLLNRQETYIIKLDTDGGSEVENIEIKDKKITKLPDEPKKEGYKFVGWTNKKGKVVTVGTKITEDTTFKAKWISNDVETSKITYDTDGGNKIEDIIIEKGTVILMPVEPTKEGYIFVGWVNEDGYLITEDITFDEDTTLKAFWISEKAKTLEIKFDTDGGNKIGSIIIENGKIILLPMNPTKEGFKFAGWVDKDGNEITKETKITTDMVIKATWKEPYTCPKDCTPVGDGSKCTKEVTTNMISKTSCPSGSISYNTWYGSGTYCINLATKEDASIRQCDTWEAAEVDYKDSSGHSWCVKTVKKVTTKGCPSGYTKSGNVCKKTETIKCQEN